MAYPWKLPVWGPHGLPTLEPASFLLLLHRRADLAMVPFKQVPMTLTLARRSSCVKAFFSRSCHATSKSAARQWIFPKYFLNRLYLGDVYLSIMTSDSGSFLINALHVGVWPQLRTQSGKILRFFTLHICNFMNASPYHPYQRKPACLMTNSSLQCCSKTSRMRRTLSWKWVPVKLEGYRKHRGLRTRQNQSNKPAWWIYWSPICFACDRSVLSMKSHKAKQRHKSQKWFTLIVHCLEIAVGSVMFDAVTLAILRPWTSKAANQSGKFEKSETGNSVR